MCEGVQGEGVCVRVCRERVCGCVEVSPHEMLQAVASTSKKRFKITEQGGCVCEGVQGEGVWVRVCRESVCVRVCRESVWVYV